MKLAILVLVLVIGVIADTQIDITCHQCGAIACIVVKGGGLKGNDLPTKFATCAQAGFFPGTVIFQCDQGGCSEGCLMIEAD